MRLNTKVDWEEIRTITIAVFVTAIAFVIFSFITDRRTAADLQKQIELNNWYVERSLQR